MVPALVSRLFKQAKAFVSAEYRATSTVRRIVGTAQPPSSAVTWAWDVLRQRNRAMRQAVDVGCGRGRNSLFLARQGVQVTALDFTPGAISALEHSADAAGLSDYIRPLVYDVIEGWPVKESSIDLVIDVFCFRHITGRDARLAYKQNVLRALDVRGSFLIAFAGIGDGYYGRYITDHCGDGSALCLDPATNLQSLLFTRDHVVGFFAPELRVLAESTANNAGDATPENTVRLAHALLFTRNTKAHGGGYKGITPASPFIQPRFDGKFSGDDR